MASVSLPPAIQPDEPSLTVVALVEDDELLPVELRDEGEQDVTEADGRPGGQRVALAVRAGVELAGGARDAVAVPLDEQVGDVHGVGQGLQGAGGGAARGGDQGQDPLVHQLACWMRKTTKQNEKSFVLIRSPNDVAVPEISLVLETGLKTSFD